MPTDTMDKLVEDADKNRRSVSNQLAVIVEDYFEAQEKAGIRNDQDGCYALQQERAAIFS